MSTIKGDYREFKLDNGLFVALQETPTKTVSGRLRVWHGALNERDGEEGLAHFLEHTLMTGGSQRYSPDQTNIVAKTFGSFNAFTSITKTQIPVDMETEDTQLFLEFVSDIAFNPRLDKTKVEMERQRILREIADDKSNPTFECNERYRESFHGKGSPHIYYVKGKESVVGSATIEDLRKFHQRGFNPNNMDIVLVGALPENIEELIELNFGCYKPGEGKRFALPRNPQLTGATFFHIEADDLLNKEYPDESSARFSMNLFGPVDTDEDAHSARILADILGDGRSILFNTISMKMGIAYSIGATYGGDNNNGYIYVGGSLKASMAEEAIDAVFEEMKKLREKPASIDETEIAKKKTRYNIKKTFETNEGRMNAIYNRIDYGITPESYIEKTKAVTPESVMEAARKYLPSSRADGKYVMMLRDPLKRE